MYQSTLAKKAIRLHRPISALLCYFINQWRGIDFFLRRTVPLEPSSFFCYEGYCFGYPLPLSPLEGDASQFPFFSKWTLWENERRLGPPHIAAHEIAQEGTGTYAHWGEYLWFSPSDNTDPRNNDKTYRLVWEGGIHFPVRLRRLRCKLTNFTFRPHSIVTTSIGLAVSFLNRSILVLLLLPHLIFRKKAKAEVEFESFYADYVKSWDQCPEPNSVSFFVALYKYLECHYYHQHLPLIQDPSLEIGVYNGITSRFFFNYPFTMGTELAFEQFRGDSKGYLHREFKQLDLINYDAFPQSAYRSIAMVHSVDDFTSRKTSLIFQAFSHLLKEDGNALFSGFTHYFCEQNYLFRAARRFNPSLSFYQFRNMHEENMISRDRIETLAQQTGLKLVAYDEFFKDPLFIAFAVIDDYASRLFRCSRIRRLLWRLPGVMRFHARFNSRIARVLLQRELVSAGDSNKRGINFFAIVVKGCERGCEQQKVIREQ